MINIREFLRRLVKYLILVLVVGFACFKLINTKLTHYEIFLISFVSGMIYCLLDIVSPSIKLVINQNTN